MQQTAESEKYLSVEEFSERIGVHPQTVRKWDNEGVLKAHHRSPGGHRYYTEAQVVAYFNGDFSNKTE